MFYPDMGRILLEEGLINEGQLQTALTIQQSQGGRLGEILMGLSPLSEDDFHQAIARHLKLPFWPAQKLLSLEIDSLLLQRFPRFMVLEHSFLPVDLEEEEGLLHLVVSDPMDRETFDGIRVYAQIQETSLGIATPSAIVRAIQYHYEKLNRVIDRTSEAGPVSSAPLAIEADEGRGHEAPLQLRKCPACGHLDEMSGQLCSHCGSPIDLSTYDPLVGKNVGSFQITAKLGEGGMGLVYRARHHETGEESAVKILRIHLSTNERVVRRFHREAQAQNQLRHPNIVHVYDFGFEDGVGFFLAMEFLRGQSLEQILEKERALFDVRRVRSIFGQVCDAMGFAHARGIYHRDLKPDNIFLLEHEQDALGEPLIKILDFGVAKMVEEDEKTKLTRTGMTIGTPRYMAPEQAGDGLSDHRSDIYSLGVILFEVLTGSLPFEGSSAYQIMLRHVYAVPPRLNQSRPEVPYPPELEELLSQTLAKEPESRPQTMENFRDRLLRALDAFERELQRGTPRPTRTPAQALSPLTPAPSASFSPNREESEPPVIVGQIVEEEQKKDSPSSSPSTSPQHSPHPSIHRLGTKASPGVIPSREMGNPSSPSSYSSASSAQRGPLQPRALRRLPQEEPWYRKSWFWVLLGLALLLALAIWWRGI